MSRLPKNIQDLNAALISRYLCPLNFIKTFPISHENKDIFKALEKVSIGLMRLNNAQKEEFICRMKNCVELIFHQTHKKYIPSLLPFYIEEFDEYFEGIETGNLANEEINFLRFDGADVPYLVTSVPEITEVKILEIVEAIAKQAWSKATSEMSDFIYDVEGLIKTKIKFNLNHDNPIEDYDENNLGHYSTNRIERILKNQILCKILPEQFEEIYLLCFRDEDQEPKQIFVTSDKLVKEFTDDILLLINHNRKNHCYEIDVDLTIFVFILDWLARFQLLFPIRKIIDSGFFKAKGKDLPITNESIHSTRNKLKSLVPHYKDLITSPNAFILTKVESKTIPFIHISRRLHEIFSKKA